MVAIHLQGYTKLNSSFRERLECKEPRIGWCRVSTRTPRLECLKFKSGNQKSTYMVSAGNLDLERITFV